MESIKEKMKKLLNSEKDIAESAIHRIGPRILQWEEEIKTLKQHIETNRGVLDDAMAYLDQIQIMERKINELY